MTPPTQPKMLIDIARYLARERADERALVWLSPDVPAQTINYGEFFARAAGYADSFREAGLSAGELVILILQPGPDVMYAFWGALLMGAIPSIFPFQTEKIDAEYYGIMVQKVVTVARPALIATYPEMLPLLEELARGAEGLRAVIALQTDRNGSAQQWIDAYPASIKDTQTAFLQHSSGTTGLQKGVTFSHRAVLQYLHSVTAALQIKQQDIFVNWLPLYHDMGLIGGFMLPLLNGSSIVSMSPFHWVRDPKVMLWAFHEYRGTVCWLPNFSLNFMAMRIRPEDLAGLDLTSLRLLINCSEPVRAESNKLFMDTFTRYGFNEKALAVSWGTAENVMASTFTDITRPPTIDYVDRFALMNEQRAIPVAVDSPQAAPQVSCGVPMQGAQVRIVDEAGNILPERTVGNLLIFSEFLFGGYYNRPDLSAKAFQDGWFITGDMAYIAEGELYICGRKKDLIIVGGKNIYPQDLEEIANTVPGVKGGRAVAFGVFNERLGTEDIYMVCEVTTADPNERRQIEREIRERLSRQADVTARRVILKEPGWLVKSTSGKMARNANREKYLSEQSAP